MKSERFNVKRKLIKLPRLGSPVLTEGAKDEFELSYFFTLVSKA